ncbi:hypothetical protein [Belnapia moabensis]|jgi:hypothetical protein|nr:hypothetical protein [Belnapia moabensis]
MIVADPTPDGRVQHLQLCRLSAGLFTSKGGGFIGGHAPAPTPIRHELW